jgi:hypothetical protein
MPMSDYRFISTWRLQAPIEQVWDEIFHTERWPSWWKYVHRVDQLDPGDAGTLVRYDWDVRTTRWWMNLAAPVARPALSGTTTRSCARPPRVWRAGSTPSWSC